MKKIVGRGLVAALVVMGAAARGEAAMITYNSLAAWQGAVGASSTEDFSGFAADTSIVPGPVALNGMSASGTVGANGAATQKVDVPALEFGGFYDLGGGAELLGDLVDGNFLRLDFTSPMSAWAADTRGIGDDGRPTVISVFDAGNVLLGTIATSSDASNQEIQFYGFQLTGGDQAAYLTLVNASDRNDVFGMDNIRFAAATPVPEPATLTLLGTGALGLLARRRRARR